MPDTDLPPAASPRQTLAMRLAERNGQRELRAARLARLRAAESPAAAPGVAEAAALELYLPPASAAPDAADGLDRLPGVGPGLVAALRRAGIARLADLAGMAAADLAARLGPIGRLVPAGRWIAFAEAETAPRPAALQGCDVG